ncbi:MAG: histidine kinase [Planctomycetes bacterium RBG_16_64_10]|nr:MAG: histidine kinase [Planctomycetes bacterium RBG_16_64_10]
MPSLFVIRGRDQGARFELDEPALSIGRDRTNAIQLHDTEVSRSHALLRRTGTCYMLADQRSSNGTFVNGNPIGAQQELELASGDQLQLGQTLLLYTGFSDTPLEDLSDKVNIVGRHQAGSSSRIVSSISHEASSALFSESAAATDSPWLARARSNLQIMYRTALAVSHTLDIDQLLRRIMDMIFEWVDADRGCVMLKKPETQALEPKVRRHRRGIQGDEKITISKTILDYVVERNEGVLTSNAREDDRWDPAKSILQMGVREAICVPMQGRYDVVGVIYIDTSIAPQQIIRQGGTGNRFTDEHLKLMIAIAHQAALAVEDTAYYKAMVQAERLAAVGQTIATLSHHIKNILQGVRGGSYLIELGLEDHRRAADHAPADVPKFVEAVGMIRKGWDIVEKNQEKISALVLDMLTFSKEREPETAAANLNEIVADVVELMQSRAVPLGVTLEWRPAARMPTLLFDPEGLHRAVLNVVTNAIDACDANEAGCVQVSTQYARAEQFARVIVTDNGSGIPADDLEKIFTIFVSRKGGRGTGLGLPVSQKILKEHGGRILVNSQPGQGSQFTLELPAVPPGAKDDAGPTLASTATAQSADQPAGQGRQSRTG